jgi:hypothetical protein
MPATRYDIYAEQGSTFKLHMDYKYLGGTGIDLSGYHGAMQVRRSENDSGILLFLTENGVTGGGITSEFTGSAGIRGVGGISFNTSINGSTGHTGGIFFRIDHTTMSFVPKGKHFYDFELQNPSGEVFRLIEGVFEVPREITRT